MKAFIWILAVALVTVSCTGRERQQDIAFAPMAFFDSAETTGDGYVYVAGTLTGEGVGYKNNTTAVVCYRERMECLTYGVNQIGPNQIGRLDSPVVYPVTEWNPLRVVASGPGDTFNCRKVTISIVRKPKQVVWVEEPMSQSSAACKNGDTRLLKWSIEDSKFGKQ